MTVGPVAHGGHCVARHEGRVVFVRHSLPGERVVVRVTEDRHPGFCRADAIEVLEASPSRVERPCPYSGPGLCGGCDWQHVDPAEQRRLKADVVREQLARLAGLDDVAVTVEELPGGPLRWRSRARFAVDRTGVVRWSVLSDYGPARSADEALAAAVELAASGTFSADAPTRLS